jgi:hypothetical protein
LEEVNVYEKLAAHSRIRFNKEDPLH